MEGNQAKLLAKVAKYKEQLEAFQETIKEHQKVQDELHEKLKTETKSNAGQHYFSLFFKNMKPKVIIFFQK